MTYVWHRVEAHFAPKLAPANLTMFHREIHDLNERKRVGGSASVEFCRTTVSRSRVVYRLRLYLGWPPVDEYVNLNS
jgi:hypothetical protein